jgi:hypothetical protein
VRAIRRSDYAVVPSVNDFNWCSWHNSLAARAIRIMKIHIALEGLSVLSPSLPRRCENCLELPSIGLDDSSASRAKDSLLSLSRDTSEKNRLSRGTAEGKSTRRTRWQVARCCRGRKKNPGVDAAFVSASSSIAR